MCQPHVRGAGSLVGGQRLDESVPVPSERGGMKRGSVRERLQDELAPSPYEAVVGRGR
jgi:hypothetical protein